MLVQIFAFCLGVFTYHETPDILKGEANLTTGWLPTNYLNTYFENLRDAEIQNKLEDFWGSKSNEEDENEIKKITLLLPKAGEKKTIDTYGFRLSFELKKVESTRETENRLLKVLNLNLKPRPEIQRILTGHISQANKLSQFVDSLNQLEEELKNGKTLFKNTPILISVRKEIQYRRDSIRHRCNLDISVKSLSVERHKNLKPTIFLILLVESLAGLFYFSRFLWKGF